MPQIGDFVKRLRKLLGGSYRFVRFTASIAYLGWGADLRKRMDQGHLTGGWRYDIPRVRERYSRVLAALTRQLGAGPWGDALEVGCSEGPFTVHLAQLCRSVLACDISPVACARAAQRCSQYSQVRVEQINIVDEGIPQQYDLIFLMEVLENIHGRKRLKGVATKLASALHVGGLLIFCDYRLPANVRSTWWSRWFLEGADNHLAFLCDGFGLRLVHQEIHHTDQATPYPGHVIALLEKVDGAASNPALQP